MGAAVLLHCINTSPTAPTGVQRTSHTHHTHTHTHTHTRTHAHTHLVGEAVQRCCKAIHGCAEGQVGVRESTAHQVAGVGTDVPSFMVTEATNVTTGGWTDTHTHTHTPCSGQV